MGSYFAPFFLIFLLFLASCGGDRSDSPTFSLDTPDPTGADGLAGPKVPVFSDDPSQDTLLWPEALFKARFLHCGYVREDENSSHILSRFALAATPSAGVRLSFFRDEDSQDIIEKIRGLSTLGASLIFTGARRAGGRTRLQVVEDAIFVADLRENGGREQHSKARLWSPLPTKRLSTSQWSAKLPAWLVPRDFLKTENELSKFWIMPEEASGLSYKLYREATPGSLTLANPSVSLGAVSDSFPVAFNPISESAVFQSVDAATLNPSLQWVNTKIGFRMPLALQNEPRAKLRHFVAWSSLTDPSFWVWADLDLKRELLLVRREGNNFIRVEAPILSSQAEIPQLFRTDQGWILANDSLRRLEMLDNSFELLSALPYPENVESMMGGWSLTSNIWIFETKNNKGLHQVRLLNRALGSWRGPISKSPCKGPAL